MIYIIATQNRTDELQPKIFKFLKCCLQSNNVEYKIIYTPQHIIESSLSEIQENDFVLWHPSCAYNNLELVKRFNYSIVILLTKTILIQKISHNNPINENMAINHGFSILYVDETFSDITNNDWKLCINESNYKITHRKFLDLILNKNADSEKINP